MLKSSDLDVAYIARLARLNLTDAETELFQKQLGDVLKYAEKLTEVDVSHVEPAAHALPIFNVFREDTAREVIDALRARIEDVDGKIGAYLSLDFEAAAKEAEVANVDLPLGG